MFTVGTLYYVYDIASFFTQLILDESYAMIKRTWKTFKRSYFGYDNVSSGNKNDFTFARGPANNMYGVNTTQFCRYYVSATHNTWEKLYVLLLTQPTAPKCIADARDTISRHQNRQVSL